MGRPALASVAASAAALLLIISFTLQLAGHAHAATTVGFYDTTCPRAEAIVKQIIQSRFASDRTITAGLLRVFFHDCFVNGCDASVLIDSTPGNSAEKDAGPNQTLRDLDIIDQIKAALEAACPGVVSCADIIALAVRDSIALAGGPSYAVGCGRLDGLRSKEADADILPSPSSTVDEAKSAFASQGLSLNDMVILLGAHTVGFAHCGFFSDRLFNFQGTGAPDPTMNPSLVSRLSNVCPDPSSSSTADPTVSLDQGTRDAFDSSYFSQLKLGNGILQIDQELTGDPRTSPLVNQFTNQAQFFSAFVQSITTLGNLNVKNSPSQGQIRTQCHRINPPKPPTPATPPPKPPLSSPPPPPTPTTPPPKPPTPPPKPPLSSPPPPPTLTTPPPKAPTPPPKAPTSPPPPPPKPISPPTPPPPKPTSPPPKPTTPPPKPTSPPPKPTSPPPKPTSPPPKPKSPPPKPTSPPPKPTSPPPKPKSPPPKPASPPPKPTSPPPKPKSPPPKPASPPPKPTSPPPKPKSPPPKPTSPPPKPTSPPPKPTSPPPKPPSPPKPKPPSPPKPNPPPPPKPKPPVPPKPHKPPKSPKPHRPPRPHRPPPRSPRPRRSRKPFSPKRKFRQHKRH